MTNEPRCRRQIKCSKSELGLFRIETAKHKCKECGFNENCAYIFHIDSEKDMEETHYADLLEIYGDDLDANGICQGCFNDVRVLGLEVTDRWGDLNHMFRK